VTGGYRKRGLGVVNSKEMSLPEAAEDAKEKATFFNYEFNKIKIFS
jgi:hypothetical protein